jgi:GntR family transcriptional regulator
VIEQIELAAARFPGLAERPIPNNLYQLYAVDYGTTVASATERLKAIAADAHQAEALEIAPGTPLLAIDRRATALDGQVVERRFSFCRSDDIHYLSELR